MRIDEDDSGRDPQTTLQPGRPQQSRTTETRGRRLILGSPRMTTATAEPQTHPSPDRGFRLGKATNVAKPATTSNTTVQPWILMVAGGALLLLVVALLFRPASTSSAEARANEQLLAQYTRYLEITKGVANSSEISERRKDVVGRLQAVAWARAIDDRAALEQELTALLFLDDDKRSPLYQYSVSQLKQLGPPKKRGAGL